MISIGNISAKNIDNFSSDFDTYLSTISPQSSTLHLTKNEASTQFSDFYTNFKKLYDHNFVENIDFNGTKRNFVEKPWMTIGLSKSCKTKNKLHNIWIKSRGTAREPKAEKNYKQYRSKLRDILKTQKTSYFKKRFDKCNGDIKKCWKVLNEMRHKQSKLTFPNYIEFNNSLITNRRCIVTRFNDYFVNIANNLNSKKLSNEFTDYTKFLKNKVSETMFLYDIESSEIQEIIKNLNPNKSSDISPRV